MQDLHYFPGHMKKTQRAIAENIKKMDAVCEVLDARIPISSRNPDIDDLTAGRPRLIVLNHTDQADEKRTKQWAAYFRGLGWAVMETSAKSGSGVKQFAPAVRSLLAEKIKAYEEKGQAGRTIRVMVVGIPNVGKSTFINKVSGRKTAKAEDRPGVTRSNQWVPVDSRLELLDTPGILWPKFEDQKAAERLAFIGAIRDEVVDVEELASALIEFLAKDYPECLKERYKIEPEDGKNGYDLLSMAGRKRGFLMSGGEVNTERMANILLDEFRAGKLGRFTLETPEDIENGIKK
ncbi:MAG: ribosome biogenesis GTPase YlqF [Oscillospiraceae bacterium]|nr:ribosome biogenesis GTPase YlqF [Oscillospiraceae bacterium]